jgi:hypothetical protein
LGTSFYSCGILPVFADIRLEMWFLDQMLTQFCLGIIGSPPAPNRQTITFSGWNSIA